MSLFLCGPRHTYYRESVCLRLEAQLFSWQVVKRWRISLLLILRTRNLPKRLRNSIVDKCVFCSALRGHRSVDSLWAHGRPLLSAKYTTGRGPDASDRSHGTTTVS